MFTYEVEIDPVFGIDGDQVNASYYKIADDRDFIEFKNSDHEVVYAVQARHVLRISRIGEAV